MECDDECQIEERNRRLAIGLQIRNPDLSAKLTPRYSDFLKQFAVRDEGFCNKVHEKLTELVLLAQNVYFNIFFIFQHSANLSFKKFLFAVETKNT